MTKYYTFFLFCLVHITLSSQQVIHSEMLGRPTDRSIAVLAFFDQKVEACVQYSATSDNFSDQTTWTPYEADAGVDVTIQNLLPNTQYYYRLCYRKDVNTSIQYRPIYTFHTQRPKGESFTFVVQADPHIDEQSDTAIYRRCLQNQLEDKPDFMIDLGDIFMSDKLKNSQGKLNHDTIIFRCKLMRSLYEKTCHSVPLFIALGNHEGESGWQLNNTTENVAIWGTTERKKYYHNPYPDGFYTGDETMHPFVGLRENYYAWTWGDALFVVLDPYWYTKPKPDAQNGWRWTLGKMQYDWLKSTLESSTQKYKFVFAHQLVGGDPDGRGGTEFAHLYEWGGQNLDGTDGFTKNRPGWYKPIKDLLVENEVSVFFHGHDHFFGKQEKDCLIYQETPQPSHPNFSNAGQADDYGYFEGQILPNAGHIRVTVAPDAAKVEYVRAYKPTSETNNRKNKDVSATYFIGGDINCYDTLSTSTSMVWNHNYFDELIYPNPFSDDVNIKFSLDHSDEITIMLLNNNGQVVHYLLHNNRLAAGEYAIIWDGKNASGSPLPNGLYTYIISTPIHKSTTGNIMLAK